MSEKEVRFTAISASNSRDERKLESVAIINSLRRGTVPRSGLSRLAVGLGTEEKVITSQLNFVAANHADCKFVRGEYGSGKTFLISRAVELARSQKFATSHVVISPDTPLHKLQTVYAKICSGISTNTEEHALKSIIDTWIYGIEDRLISTGIDENDEKLAELTAKEIEAVLTRVSGISSGLAAALRTYYTANNKGDFATAQSAIGWISGDTTVGRSFKSQAGVKGGVTEADALLFLKGIVYVITQAGYSGLLVTFDEVETAQAFGRPQREKGYINLRQIVDMIDKNELSNCFFLFAGTPAFFDSSKGIRSLPPLYDRIGIIADDGFSNPMQTQIVLKKFDVEKLQEVSRKVMEIYAEAYGEVDKTRVSPRFVKSMIEKVTNRFGGRVDVVPRLYLREFVDVLDKCALYPNFTPIDKYAFTPETSQETLNNEEKAVMEVSW
ncbi:MAG: BREX system ATP-binding protein BrxD [Methanocorpusculum sp.]|nr:BREX system ATP-binding protein BrxD [Methanocorpusculum sp.]